MNKKDLLAALDKALLRERGDWEDDGMACADVVVDFVYEWLLAKPIAVSSGLTILWREEMS